jgi:hypothetical protein
MQAASDQKILLPPTRANHENDAPKQTTHHV